MVIEFRLVAVRTAIPMRVVDVLPVGSAYAAHVRSVGKLLLVVVEVEERLAPTVSRHKFSKPAFQSWKVGEAFLPLESIWPKVK